VTTSTANAPTYASDGHIVWKPQVGYVFDPEKKVGHSYGGIVTALQEAIADDGITPKAYPHNFAGIIAAIQDLESAQDAGPPVVIDPIPPGSIVDPITGDLNVIIKPADGLLWFDSRQGRLFVAADNEWWQTNGADGLAYIRGLDNPPLDSVLPGQFWYEPESNDLYVYSEGEWVRIVDADGLQTTATLPLDIGGPRQKIAAYQWEIVPEINLDNFHVQKDYNEWIFAAIAALETEVSTLDPVYLDEAPPDAPRPGALWYDTESLELSIWYEDGDSGQWVPTSAAYTYDEDLAVVTAAIETEVRVRENAIHQIHQALQSVNGERLDTIENSITELQTSVDNIEIPDYNLDIYAQRTELDPLITDITALEDLTSEYSELEQTAYDNHSMIVSMQQTVDKLPTKQELAAVEDKIPSLEEYATTSKVDQKIAAITGDFLPRTGGTLTGSFTLNNSNSETPTFDFSQYISSGQNAFKFQTMSNKVGDYTTFGVTNNFWEYAWKFASDEDFCWIYNDTNKVFSITKDGPACSQLYLGDITSNSSHERMIVNKIDVRDRLTKYQTAFTMLRSKAQTANTLEELKAGIIEALSQV